MAMTLGLATFGISQLTAKAADDVRECDDVSIIKCGVMSKAEFTQKVNANTTGDVKQILAHYGIDPNAISSAKEGVAQQDGKVVVDGRVVATGATDIGRTRWSDHTDHAITIDGKTYWQRPHLARDFQIYAFFDANGKFIAAIAKSCGNPIFGTPTPPPVAPSIACQALQVSEISRTQRKFTATTTEAKGGAKVTGYTFNFGDNAKVDSTSATATHTYSKTGTYTASVTVHTSIGDKTGTQCTAKVVIVEQPVAACEGLSATLSDRTHYELKASASASNATVNKYHYIIKDQSGKTVLDTETTKTDITGELQPGTYQATVTAETSLGNKTGENCVTSFTVEQAPCTIPGKEQFPAGSDQCVETPTTPSTPPTTPETPTVLPKTGASNGLLSTLGLGSIATAVSYYVASRRSLFSAFIK